MKLVSLSLLTVSCCSNITIERFVSPKPSPIRICEGKYLLPVADVMAATMTVGALALKSSACTTKTGR